MNTKPYFEPNGRLATFEVEKIYISVRDIANLIRSVDGVSEVHIRRIFSLQSEIHIEFSYMNGIFVVYEPFGESNVYWIGPKDMTLDVIDLGAIEQAFRRYQPSLIRRILGIKILK